MVSFRSVADGSLDEEALEVAVDVYNTEDVDHDWVSDFRGEIFDISDSLKGSDLSSEGIPDFIDRLESASTTIQDGPDVEFDDLQSEAREDPTRLGQTLRALYEGDTDLATRIDDFRDAISVRTAEIGYLLAASNPSEYAIYDDDVFKTFLRYFSGYETPSYDSPGEKYDLYTECLDVLADILQSEGEVQEADVIDASHFMWSIITDDNLASDFRLRYLVSFARRLKAYEDNTERLIEDLGTLPRPFLREEAARYEDRTKIARIRYRVLESILDGEQVDFQRYQEEENERYEKNILHSWRDFTILAQLYFNLYKARVELYLDDLIDHLRSELGATELEAHVITFQGASNFPRTRCWVALYPADRDFKESYQLFFDTSPDGVEHGLVAGSDLEYGDQAIDTAQLEDIGEISVSAVLEKFEDVFEEFERRNYDLDGGGSTPDGEPEFDELDDFPEIARQLEKSKQMIFYGPPGTGKTYAAINFAKWWISEEEGDVGEQVKTVTFHPSFTYEDFMEGLTAQSQEGVLTFDVDKGVFAEFCEAAAEAYEDADGTPPRYVLIIDEINRGNLASVFGETITLLEPDKRSGGSAAVKTDLAHSGDSLSIPPNLYLIGTMNTADRSIALVDAALRRRFRFKAYPPDYDLLFEEYGFEDEADAEDAAGQQSGEESLRALSILGLREINHRILRASSLGRGKQIGHSYLLDRESGEAIVDAWRYEILPLLEEYYFGQLDSMRSQLFDGNGEALFDWKHQQIEDFDGDDLRQELRTLVEDEG